MQVITQPNPLHWALAERWRSEANWLAFTGKSPTSTHNPATDGASAQRKQRRIWPPIPSATMCLFADIRKRQSEVMDNCNKPLRECFPLRATRTFWIVSCQCVLSDTMVARSLCADIRMRPSEVKNNYSGRCGECILLRATRAPQITSC